jgi:hypothetical protein
LIKIGCGQISGRKWKPDTQDRPPIRSNLDYNELAQIFVVGASDWASCNKAKIDSFRLDSFIVATGAESSGGFLCDSFFGFDVTIERLENSIVAFAISGRREQRRGSYLRLKNDNCVPDRNRQIRVLGGFAKPHLERTSLIAAPRKYSKTSDNEMRRGRPDDPIFGWSLIHE